MSYADHTGRGNSPAAASEDDNIFGYDANEAVLNSLQEEARNRASTTAPANDDVIGEEIKVRKARKPLPKLDEERLLSQAGIPKLRRITKTRLRLKGKGHEFSDVGRLLNLYQLWLDDLYPKAKFADGVAMIEKLGHTKRMRMLRRTWIDEGKPRDNVDEVLVTREEVQDETAGWTGDGTIGQDKEQEATAGDRINVDDDDLGDGLFVKDVNEAPDTFGDDDDLDMLLAEDGSRPAPTSKANDAGTDQKTDDIPDDLDELLGEAAAPTSTTASRPQPAQKTADEDFADEMDAIGDMW